ncbi:hypothetical protein ACFLWZ_07155 [Chloroflexota bacterium]
MQGEFIGVWPETWREIWEPLAFQESAPEDIYGELYRELVIALKTKPTAQALADIIDDPEQSKQAFLNIKTEELSGERTLTTFFEKTYEALDDLAGDALANPYFILLETFIKKFNLRYDLRRSCTLCPTLPGVFTSLMCDLKTITSQDAPLNSLMKDFEEALRDLRIDCSESRIKSSIQKQVNLLEAISCRYPGVTQDTIGAICSQLDTWPHAKIKEAMKSLYGFTCDYPGIRHGGTPASALRALRIIDMRDMVAISILLAGFTPYMTDQLNADNIYRRA